jgi:hypothetical protein
MYGGRQLAHARFAAWNLGEPWSIPTVAGSGIRPSLPGSGKLGTPWPRTHCANRSPFARTSCCADRIGGRPPFGRNLRQAPCASANRELLTPSCCRPTFGIAPPPPGSGNLDTPWERMQPAKATALLGGAAAGAPPQPAAGSASSVNATNPEARTTTGTRKAPDSEISLKRL